jgi:hypothetical protein
MEGSGLGGNALGALQRCPMQQGRSRRPHREAAPPEPGAPGMRPPIAGMLQAPSCAAAGAPNPAGVAGRFPGLAASAGTPRAPPPSADGASSSAGVTMGAAAAACDDAAPPQPAAGWPGRPPPAAPGAQPGPPMPPRPAGASSVGVAGCEPRPESRSSASPCAGWMSTAPRGARAAARMPSGPWLPARSSALLLCDMAGGLRAGPPSPSASPCSGGNSRRGSARAGAASTLRPSSHASQWQGSGAAAAAAAAAPAAAGRQSLHAPALRALSGKRAGLPAMPLLPGRGALAGTAAGCQALAHGAAGAVAGAAAGLSVSVRVKPTGEPAGVGEREMNSWTWRSHGEAATCGAHGPGHRLGRTKRFPGPPLGATLRDTMACAASCPPRASPRVSSTVSKLRSRPLPLLGSCGAQRPPARRGQAKPRRRASGVGAHLLLDGAARRQDGRRKALQGRHRARLLAVAVRAARIGAARQRRALWSGVCGRPGLLRPRPTNLNVCCQAPNCVPPGRALLGPLREVRSQASGFRSVPARQARRRCHVVGSCLHELALLPGRAYAPAERTACSVPVETRAALSESTSRVCHHAWSAPCRFGTMLNACSLQFNSSMRTPARRALGDCRPLPLRSMTGWAGGARRGARPPMPPGAQPAGARSADSGCAGGYATLEGVRPGPGGVPSADELASVPAPAGVPAGERGAGARRGLCQAIGGRCWAPGRVMWGSVAGPRSACRAAAGAAPIARAWTPGGDGGACLASLARGTPPLGGGVRARRSVAANCPSGSRSSAHICAGKLTQHAL